MLFMYVTEQFKVEHWMSLARSGLGEARKIHWQDCSVGLKMGDFKATTAEHSRVRREHKSVAQSRGSTHYLEVRDLEMGDDEVEP